MKSPFILAGCLMLWSVTAHSQYLAWVKQLAGADQDRGYAVAVDNTGNVYTAGVFRGTADFDPGPDTFNLTAVNVDDIFIAKFNTAGNLIWAKHIGNAWDDVAYSIALDVAGNLYVTGYFGGTVDFDPGPATFNLTAVNSYNDVFILKLNSSGAFVWARQLSGPANEYGYAIALDAAGNAYTTGFFSGINVDFDPGPGTFLMHSSTSLSVFISKLDVNGNFVWAKQFDGSTDDRGWAINTDALNNVYATGFFTGTVDFNPDTGTYNLTSAGDADVFILKLTAAGDLVWAKRMGGTGYDAGKGIDVDAAGNVYSTGWFQDVADFDPGPGVFNLVSPYPPHKDAFVSKLDATGNFSGQ